MKWYRWLTLALFVTLIIAAIGYGFMPRPQRVETAAVRRAPLLVTIEAEGKTRVKHRYEISAPVAGVARRIELDVGDAVSKGQVLAWLEPRYSAVLDPRSRAEAQARLAASQARLQGAQEDVEAASAAADYAGAELSRLRRLREAGVVSQETLDQADAEARRNGARLRAARAAVEVAKFELEAARSALRYSAARELDFGGEPGPEQVTIKAPVDGQVLKVHQRSEYVVEPGRPLLEIGDPSDLEVEIDVLSSDAVRIKPDSRVLFERWGGGEVLEGRVRVIEPAGFTKISALGVEEQRVLVIADFVSPRERWARLGDGYRVEARFVLWQSDDALQIPTSALLRAGDGDDDWAVYRVAAGVATLTPVALGQRGDLAAQIVTGLEAGDTVIVHPADALYDGARVEAVNL